MSESYQSPWRNSMVMAPSRYNATVRPQPPQFPPTRSSFVEQQRQHHQSNTSSSSALLPPVRDYFEGLVKEPLQTLDVPACDDRNVRISDCTFIGSYNWVKEDSGTPTILVPGSPPHWLSRQLPYTIPPDRGLQFCDQNGYKMPKAVLLPLVVAVNKRFEMKNPSSPPFPWSDVDVVTDRNNLRKLLRWVVVEGEKPPCLDFRVDLQLAGAKTVLMTRFSERYRELFSGRTYGFSFEKSSTDPAPGCKNTSGHHRIVTYDMNGLKMVVRFEVDACTRPPAKYPRRSTAAAGAAPSSSSSPSIDDSQLANALSSLSLSPQSAFRSEYPLLVREGGVEVPADTVIELVTRSQANVAAHGYDWQNGYPQLFFSQTAQHYLAVHKHGRFFEITKSKLNSDKLREVEGRQQDGFKKLRKLLDVIRELVVRHGKQGRLSLVCKDGALAVYERKSDESLLPDAAMKFFEAS